MTVNQLAIVGDSLTQGVVGNFSYGLGGKGNWAQLVTDRLANIAGLGPLVSSGCRNAYNPTPTDWAYTTGGDAWSTTASTDTWDKALYGTIDNGATQVLRYANGATKIATWTASADIRFPNVGFCLYWVDYTNSGNWSYSVDGGSNWIAMGQTLANDNKICKFYIATPIASGGTVKIRAANAAGTGVGCCPFGIEIFYQTPSTASGLIVHNVAVGGSDLHHLVATTSGDRMAWFDSVKLGTGCITNTPNLGVIHENVNDIAEVNNTTTWAADLTTLRNRVAPLGPVGFINAWECNNALFINAGTQANYRAQTKTTAAGFSPAATIVDIYDQWAALGFTGNAASNTAGFLYDLTHESQAGHLDLALRLYWWIRRNFLSAYAGYPSTYTATGKQAVVQYVGKRAVVQYAVGSQIAPVPT